MSPPPPRAGARECGTCTCTCSGSWHPLGCTHTLTFPFGYCFSVRPSLSSFPLCFMFMTFVGVTLVGKTLPSVSFPSEQGYGGSSVLGVRRKCTERVGGQAVGPLTVREAFP